jgi:HlyD family secretion protein
MTRCLGRSDRALSWGLSLGILLLAACRRDSETLQGETDAKQVSVATKVTGRIDSLFVREGDSVRRGQIVATLDGPEIRAKAAQAVAARDAARAVRDKARNGSREEDVRAARNNWLRAVASARIAETTYARLDRLQREGVVPTQKRDEAEATLRANREGADAARAEYDLATAGARNEDRVAAFADLRRAEGAVTEAESYVSENVLRSAVTGQVLVKVVEQGELVSPGQPVITMVDLSDQWITLNLREDRLAGLRIGDTLPAVIPAVDSAVRPFAVYYISPLGSFATWRATREAGGFDVRTFEVRARPVHPLPTLRPGMSALVDWRRRTRR